VAKWSKTTKPIRTETPQQYNKKSAVGQAERRFLLLRPTQDLRHKDVFPVPELGDLIEGHFHLLSLGVQHLHHLARPIGAVDGVGLVSHDVGHVVDPEEEADEQHGDQHGTGTAEVVNLPITHGGIPLVPQVFHPTSGPNSERGCARHEVPTHAVMQPTISVWMQRIPDFH